MEGIASVINVTFPQVKTDITNAKEKIFIHELYDSETYANNIAIIKLLFDMVPDGSEFCGLYLEIFTITINYSDHSQKFWHSPTSTWTQQAISMSIKFYDHVVSDQFQITLHYQ